MINRVYDICQAISNDFSLASLANNTQVRNDYTQCF